MKVRAQAALTEKGRLQPFESDPGPLGPTRVDVRVTHCGICHTDSATVDNGFGISQYPLVPGHEAVTARHGIKPVIEMFPMSEADRALEHTRSGRARFRAVLVA